MGKIPIETKFNFISSLAKGLSVREASVSHSIVYSSACRILRNLNLDKFGLILPRVKRSSDCRTFILYLIEKFDNLDQVSNFFRAPASRVSALIKIMGIEHKWDLSKNHNKLLQASRMAEIFCKNLGIKVVRDCAFCRKAGFHYDLILQSYGSVDVKSTIIRKDKHGKYASFSVGNFTKGVKYAFLVVMDECRDDFKLVFAVPGKAIFGHSTIRISLNPISKKYLPFLIWSGRLIRVKPPKL